ncbi:MAG: hypothetical protein JJ902_04005 [Roseibium sp.]|nr:hypothetical protein [Roseibium sp.]
MADPRNNEEKTREDGMPVGRPFEKGNSGRPKGSRNKLGEAFLAEMLADWEEHGKSVIEDVRKDKPDVYLKVVASILPKDLNVNVNRADELSDDELLERIRTLDAAIQPYLSAQGEGGTGRGSEQETTH